MTSKRTPYGSSASAKPATRRPATPATSSGAAEADALAATPDVDMAADMDAEPAFGPVSVSPMPVTVTVTASAPAPVPAPVVAEPACRHATTRTRQRGGRIERYCERCGVLIGAANDTRCTGPVL